MWQNEKTILTESLKFSVTLKDVNEVFLYLITGLWAETILYKINSNTLRTKNAQQYTKQFVMYTIDHCIKSTLKTS